MLRPSSCYRRAKCPASYRLEQLVPERPSSVYAEEGTRLHEIAAQALKTYNTNTPEYQVNAYVNYVKNFAGSEKLYIEQRVTMPQLHELCQGTVDAFVYKDECLHVFDLKTGRMPIRAENNFQLLEYAHGAQNMLRVTLKMYYLHIVQPGINNFDLWITDDIKTDYLREIEHAAVRSDTLAFAKSNACQFCPALTYCPAWILDYAKADKLVDEEALLIRLKSDIKFAEALEERLLTEALAGKELKRFEVAYTRSREVFDEKDDLPDVLLTKAKPLTPKQALAAGVDVGIVEYYKKVINGKPKLIRK